MGAMLHELITDFSIGHSAADTRIITDELTPEASSLLKQLLNPERAQRLGVGANGAAAVKAHEYFRGMDWDGLLAKAVPGPLRIGKITCTSDEGEGEPSSPSESSLSRWENFSPRWRKPRRVSSTDSAAGSSEGSFHAADGSAASREPSGGDEHLHRQ
jgi:hypothetical protein